MWTLNNESTIAIPKASKKRTTGKRKANGWNTIFWFTIECKIITNWNTHAAFCAAKPQVEWTIKVILNLEKETVQLCEILLHQLQRMYAFVSKWKEKTPVNGNVRSMAISSGKSLHHNLTATRKLVNDLQKYFRTMKLPCELSAVKFYAFLPFLQKNAHLLLRCTTKFTRFFSLSLSFHWLYAVCDS